MFRVNLSKKVFPGTGIVFVSLISKASPLLHALRPVSRPHVPLTDRQGILGAGSRGDSRHERDFKKGANEHKGWPVESSHKNAVM